ncbi:MAG: transporter substrate-binding domain-containing protein [Pseudomonadota bacterium]
MLHATIPVLLCLSGASFAGGPVLDRIVDAGVLKVAMSGNQQPFNFVYGKRERLVGYDVDLARELARVINVELELVPVRFDDLMDALNDGRADMVISGMTITATRTQEVSFVGPYVLSGKSLLARGESAANRSSPNDFNDSSIKLAALKGSTSESLVQQQLPESELVPVADYDEGLKLLMGDEIDGMVADMPILAYTKNRYRDVNLQLIAPPLSLEPMGIVIDAGDPQLENFLRNYLTVFEKTGFLMRLYERWFEVGNSDLYR